MLDKLIFLSYALIFFLVPIFWTSVNFELFEYNKMILTYGLTVIITGSWLLKSINQRKLTINRTPLDIPLLLFLGASILSTVFSIDRHTSIWGYYSRSNGGLLSLISYLLLYFAFVSNINKEQALKLLKIGLVSGFIISLWGIFEHFGVSLSCVILREEFNAGCWVQDVQARVFATLGQPNWMAAYLGMLIFPAMFFFLTASSWKQHITYFISLITLYMGFTFTYSRGGFLGFLAGLAVFTPLFIKKSVYRNIMIITIIIFILTNAIFGSALTRFNLSQLFSQYTSEVSTGLNQSPTSEVKPGSTQLENGGTESGQIRLIVWKGALSIFKAYPVFGSGVETFAYSYYQFRPVEHNLVSEWDFLYNKAHNEFLNYLATTGIIGFSTYLLMIGVFIWWCIKRVIVIPSAARNLKIKTQNLEISHGVYPAFGGVRDDNLLITTILATYISYLVQNFFGFSVVIIAIFFYLFPAIAFVATDSVKPWRLPQLLTSILYRHPFYTNLSYGFIVLSIFYILYSIFQFWVADTYFAKGEHQNELGNPGAAYNYISDAVKLNKYEPFYKSELGYVAASSALALKDTDATLSAELKDESIKLTGEVLSSNPKNVSFWRTSVRTYFELSEIEDKYVQKTLDSLDVAISLAPTDPKLLYNKAVILGQLDKTSEAISALQRAIELKPNYVDAYFALSLFQFDSKQTELAVKTMNRVLEISPSNPEALDKLNEWGRIGIATKSAKP